MKIHSFLAWDFPMIRISRDNGGKYLQICKLFLIGLGYGMINCV